MSLYGLLSGRSVPRYRNPTAKVLMGAGIGVAAGFIAGLLLAPESGAETRALLARKAKESAAGIKELLVKYGEDNGESGS